jgi:RNA polymerase sigma factor (sigma-70 family)
VITPAERQDLYNRIVDRYDKHYIDIARYYAPNTEENDLHQHILFQIWKSLDQFEGRSTPETWAYRLALNTSKSYRRDNGRREKALNAYKATVVTKMQGGRGAAPVLKEFTDSLRGKNRDIFILYMTNVGYAEIAEIMRMSEPTVRARISRLKDKFEQLYI